MKFISSIPPPRISRVEIIWVDCLFFSGSAAVAAGQLNPPTPGGARGVWGNGTVPFEQYHSRRVLGGRGAEAHEVIQSVPGQGPRAGAERAEGDADAKVKILLSCKREHHVGSQMGSRRAPGNPSGALWGAEGPSGLSGAHSGSFLGALGGDFGSHFDPPRRSGE